MTCGVAVGVPSVLLLARLPSVVAVWSPAHAYFM